MVLIVLVMIFCQFSGICEFVHLHIIRSPGIQAVLDDFPLRR
jgi:hypothetical protein